MGDGVRKYAKVILNIIFPAACIGFAVCILPRLLIYFMPFVIGWILAMMANPLVRFLERRMKLVRKHSSMLIVVLALAVVIGLIYGSIAGYYGCWVDMVMMRICEIITALPQVVVVTMFILMFGTGMQSLILALVVRGWVGTARMIRAQFLRFRGREYVLAAEAFGVPEYAQIFRHILPNAIGPVITQTMMAVPGAIFTESFLAFIGLGLAPPEPSIGVLLSNGQQVLMQYPFQTLFPALLISVLMIAFNLMGNGLRDAFDPTQRGQE